MPLIHRLGRLLHTGYWKWGARGHKYTYRTLSGMVLAKKKAIKQAIAIMYSIRKQMARRKTLFSLRVVGRKMKIHRKVRRRVPRRYTRSVYRPRRRY